MTALEQLAAAIEAGSAGQFQSLDSEVGNRTNSVHAKRAYNGSLDAAKALHDAALPGYGWRRPSEPWTDHSIAVTCPVWREDDDEDAGGYPVFNGIFENNPARAWLLAIVRALIAKEKA